ncbi:MAG: hypothetical protein IPJ34_13700 [Myxococcales bacterium]|nr:hypothetical protein [Myxococcales bacterium]
MRFRAPIPFEPSHPDALAMYCSDGRFTHAVEALLAELGYPRLDTLTVPGGPAVLSIATASLGTFDVVRNALSFLVTGHAIAHVVLIAHDSCGYYKQRFPYESAEAMHRRQVGDLEAASKWIRGEHRKVEVTKFFARRDEHVEFERIE